MQRNEISPPEIAATEAASARPGSERQATPSSAAMAEHFQPLRAPLDSEAEHVTSDMLKDQRYEFGEVFARGGLGQIRRAFDRLLGRTVAVKETLGNASTRRFLREAQVTARLEHPAIIPIHDIGTHPDGQPYYCMKMIDGRSLETLIGEAKTLSERMMLLANVITVADAISFAHSKGVLHRDLKPANILIGAFGETWLIDWGLAGFLGERETEEQSSADGGVEPEHQARLTQTGEFMGTLPYMSPEQLEGVAVDQRADVYALGAVLYQTLSGLRPYSDVSGPELLVHILSSPPVDLERIAPTTPQDLVAIVRKAMARDCEARYPSARAFADDLRRFQNGRLVLAYNYRASDIMRRWARRHRPILLASVVATILLMAFGAYTVQRIALERDLARQNERLAAEQRDAADFARRQADQAVMEARGALSEMHEQSARHELVNERRPLDAIKPLLRALAFTPGREPLRHMLGQALSPIDDVRCESDYLRADYVVFHPQQPLVMAHSSNSSVIKLVSALDCSHQHTIRLEEAASHSVNFSADGRELLAWSETTDSALQRFDIQTGALPTIQPLHENFASGAVSRSGQFLTLHYRAYSDFRSSVLYLNGSTAAPQRFDLLTSNVRVSPVGSIWAYMDKEVVTVRDAGVVKTSYDMEGQADLLAVSSVGDLLIERLRGLEIHHPDHSSTSLERCVRHSQANYRSGAFHPSKAMVIAQDQNGDLGIWDTNTGVCIGAIEGHSVRKVVFSGSGANTQILALYGDARLAIWGLRDEQMRHEVTLSAHESGVFDFDVQESTGSLSTLGRNGSLKVWDLRSIVDFKPAIAAPMIAMNPSGTLTAIADHASVSLVEPLRPGQREHLVNVADLDELRWDSENVLLGRSGSKLFIWSLPLVESSEAVDVSETFDSDGLIYDLIDRSSFLVVSGALRRRGVKGEKIRDIRVVDLPQARMHAFSVDGNVWHRAESTLAAGGSRILLSDTGLLVDTESFAVAGQVSPRGDSRPEWRADPRHHQRPRACALRRDQGRAHLDFGLQCKSTFTQGWDRRSSRIRGASNWRLST
jgi:WD40 repeat protein